MRHNVAGTFAVLLIVCAPLTPGCGGRSTPPGVAYDPEHRLSADVFLPAPGVGSAATRPAVILMHGSCYNPGGSRRAMMRHGQTLAHRGFVSVAIDYRLTDAGGQYPTPIRDVKCALRWLKTNADQYGVDPERVAVLGASAGGYLASMVGATQGLPQFDGPECGVEDVDDSVAAVVALYAVSDLVTRCRTRMRACEERFLGVSCDPESPAEIFWEASPLRYVDRIRTPYLLIAGTADADIPYEQSRILARALEQRGSPVTLIEYPGAPHGFDVLWGTPDASDALSRIGDFLEATLGSVPQQPATSTFPRPLRGIAGVGSGTYSDVLSGDRESRIVGATAADRWER